MFLYRAQRIEPMRQMFTLRYFRRGFCRPGSAVIAHIGRVAPLIIIDGNFPIICGIGGDENTRDIPPIESGNPINNLESVHDD